MTTNTLRPMCGIIMPISAIDGCAESHWVDVQDILTEAIEHAGFDANIVSNADDVGIIHKRIIQNLYDNPIVVCDVSAKNANVMFELGMRLAFDKPTLIVKDDKTSFSFDTAAIEHIEYPRDLRFAKIVEFKEKLSAKLKATHEKAGADPAFTTFLKHFGEFKVAKLDKKEVSSQEYLLEELRSIRSGMRRLERATYLRDRDIPRSLMHSRKDSDVDVCLGPGSKQTAEHVLELARSYPEIQEPSIYARAPNHFHLRASLAPGSVAAAPEIEMRIRQESRSLRRPEARRPLSKKKG